MACIAFSQLSAAASTLRDLSSIIGFLERPTRLVLVYSVRLPDNVPRHATPALRAARGIGAPLGRRAGLSRLPVGTAFSIWVVSEGGCADPPHPKIGYKRMARPVGK